jgi:hypothetical protein
VKSGRASSSGPGRKKRPDHGSPGPRTWPGMSVAPCSCLDRLFAPCPCQRRIADWRRLSTAVAFAALHSIACDGGVHGDGAQGDGVHDDVPVDAGAPAGARTSNSDAAQTVPERFECTATPSGCQPGSDGPVFTPLAVTLQEFLFDSCEVYCGQLELGTSRGCVTRIDNVAGSVSNFECVNQHLLGTRWECAPTDGLSPVYLGSCTIR